MQLLNDPVFKTVAECTLRVLAATSSTPENIAATLTYAYIMAQALSDQFAVPFEQVLRAMNIPEEIIAAHQKNAENTKLMTALSQFNA